MRHNYLIVLIFAFFLTAACNSEENTDKKDLTLEETNKKEQEGSDNSKEDSEQMDEQNEQAVELSAGEDFYAHFELPEKNLSANLRAAGSELFLMLSLPSKSQVLSLNGSYTSGSEFQVKGVTDETGKQAQYTGKITSDFALELKDDNTGEKYLLHQDYSGGLPFQAYSFADEAETESGTFSDQMYILVPKSNSKLKSKIFKLYFDKEINSGKGNAAVNDLLKSHHNSLLKTFKEDGMGGLWSREINTEVLFNDRGIVAYGIHEFSYTGGAHGNGASLFLVYDLKNDKTVELKDVFSESDMAILSEKIYEQIKKDRDMGDDEMRSEYDLPIAPTNNFYFTSAGMYFIYNAYELTSYAMGADAVFFSYPELNRSFDSSFIKRISE